MGGNYYCYFLALLFLALLFLALLFLGSSGRIPIERD